MRIESTSKKLAPLDGTRCFKVPFVQAYAYAPFGRALRNLRNTFIAGSDSNVVLQRMLRSRTELGWVPGAARVCANCVERIALTNESTVSARNSVQNDLRNSDSA